MSVLLLNEAKIAASEIRKVFTPHMPILSKDFFCGRRRESIRAQQAIETPGQHALIFGERGVGKSSLANYIYDAYKGKNPLTMKIGCDTSTTFPTIARRILSNSFRSRDGQLTIPVGEHPTIQVDITPASVVDDLNRAPGAQSEPTPLILIDEADVIRAGEDKQSLASFIKLLSDSGSAVKVIVVGVAETGKELTDGHPSVGRCLKEIKLGVMDDVDVKEIVVAGSHRANLHFSDDTIEVIVRLSGGYPHFAHLLALKSAESAILGNNKTVSLTHLRAGLPNAATDAEASLTTTYLEATRSHGTDMYKKVMIGAANAVSPNRTEFTASELRESIRRKTGESVTQNGLNNYLKALVDEQGKMLLRRLAKGVYRFNDPRMATYIKIAAGDISQ